MKKKREGRKHAEEQRPQEKKSHKKAEHSVGNNIVNKNSKISFYDLLTLIKDKKHSVNQVYINHSDILYFSKTTFYKYVNTGVLSLSNTDLPKKSKYKKRKVRKDKENKRNIAVLKGRKYEDYLEFIAKHKRMSKCQIF